MSTAIYAEFPAPPFSEKEALRYARASTDMDRTLLKECYQELAPQLTYKTCRKTFPLIRNGSGLDLGFSETGSLSLAKALNGCGRIVVFAATVGLAPDRLTARWEKLEPAKALMLHAIGTERVEALCDLLCEHLEEVLPLTPRFSPGYGDLPLTLQKPLLAALDAERLLGIRLSSGLLMLPSKSVTAIAGIREESAFPG